MFVCVCVCVFVQLLRALIGTEKRKRNRATAERTDRRPYLFADKIATAALVGEVTREEFGIRRAARNRM